MRIRNLLSLLMLAFLGHQLHAQLPYSKEFSRAVEAGTRTGTGYPGNEYRNNFAEYKISASFDPDTHILDGEEVVQYFFNTPVGHTSRVVINLYRNIYKKGVPRQRPCHPDDITDDGMLLESVLLIQDGKEIPLSFEYHNTKAVVQLKETMYPGSKITLKIKWSNQIAAQTHHRGGMYGDYSWFVPYWYPQIAVFDDLYGWDFIDHSGNEEFAFEFANYDVSITLGHGMMCWATGSLQNMNEIYSAPVVSNYKRAIQSDAITTVVGPSNLKTALKKQTNIWKFKADSVPDFVFACSNSMSWAASGLMLRPGKPRTVVATVYKHAGFSKNIDVTRKTLSYLSKERPGVVYPYQHMTIFEGSGGMEFPMMINEDFDDRFDSDFFTTSHEVTHSYFPFITGMYQNRYGFMDEGLTQFVPQYFQNSNFRNRNIISQAAKNTERMAGNDDMVPIMTPSYSMADSWVFTINSYYKPQIAYTVIEDAVGKDMMTKILREFTLAWAGKHPHPYDFFNMCMHLSGKDLSELIHSWFFIKGVPDLAVDSISGSDVAIANLGDMMLPIDLEVTYTDGTSENIRRDALVWAGGKRSVVISLSKPVEVATIQTSWIPDADASNNSKSIY